MQRPAISPARILPVISLISSSGARSVIVSFSASLPDCTSRTVAGDIEFGTALAAMRSGYDLSEMQGKGIDGDVVPLFRYADEDHPPLRVRAVVRLADDVDVSGVIHGNIRAPAFEYFANRRQKRFRRANSVCELRLVFSRVPACHRKDRRR